MSFTLKAAEELGIPEVFFWTTSACGFMGYVQYRHLIDRGFFPLKDESCLTNGHLDTVVDWIPAMKGVRLRDLPSFIRTTNPDDIVVNFAMGEVERANDASAILLNTFDELEHEVLQALSTMFPPIYTIGPLQLLLNQMPDNDLKSIESNLWKEEPGCLEWLDAKEPESVVYVNFGSVTVMTPQQLVEFAWGLANANLKFLWIIRPDLVAGDAAILPADFVAQTKERSFGWNSTIEGLCGGVPMICWPFFAEQMTNCRYFESLVRGLMEGEKGKEMKKKAMEWKRMAEAATTTPAGSSYSNLDKMINQVLLSKSPC
ncbi:unnamed protein product, partial [Vitis vinifera]